MGDVIAFIEQREGEIRGVGREVATVATQTAAALGGSAMGFAVGGPGLSEKVSAVANYGLTTVRVAEHEELGRYSADAYAEVIAASIRERGCAAVVFPATAQGRDLAPRVAARLGVGLAADVTAVEVTDGAVQVTRPIYAGKAFATVGFTAAPAVISIRPNVFPAEEGAAPAEIETFGPELDGSAARTRFVRLEAGAGDALDVSEASTVVSGGRGMKEPDRWTLLEELREALGEGAALGASRAVVDAGWRPHGEQVGQTGKTVSPQLYFAIGISGAIQHLAGMRTSGTIVAINKDPDAPIFNVADYGVVGDLFEVVPRLSEELRRVRSES